MVIILNNKGQTLAIFVIIIPIILLFLMLIADYGLMSVEKRHIDNCVKDSINFGLKNLNDNNLDEKMKNLINKNIDLDDIKSINIDITDNSVSIDLLVKYDMLFNILNNKNDIRVSYFGTIENGNIKIIKR